MFLQHVSEMLDEHFPGVDIKIFYLCKSNLVPLLSPQALRESNYGVISVCRPLECERILREIGAKWNGLIWIAEDVAMLDASMDVVTSRLVRVYVKEGKSVRHWMGDLIDEYFRVHRVGAKMVGDELWETQERQLPHVAARPTLPPMAKVTPHHPYSFPTSSTPLPLHLPSPSTSLLPLAIPNTQIAAISLTSLIVFIQLQMSYPNSLYCFLPQTASSLIASTF